MCKNMEISHSQSFSTFIQVLIGEHPGLLHSCFRRVPLMWWFSEQEKVSKHYAQVCLILSPLLHSLNLS